MVNMLSPRSPKRLETHPRDCYRSHSHSDTEAAETCCEIIRLVRRHREDRLADPHDARTVDESRFLSPAVADDSFPPEDDLADSRCDGPAGA